MRSQAAITALTLALGLAAVVAACGTSDDPEPAASADESDDQTDEADDSAPAVEAGEGSDDGSDDGSAQGPASPTASTTVELGVQVADDSGVVVTLERLVVEPTFVVLELSAANGSPDKVALAADNETGIELTTDDPSTVLTYRAPSENESLELSSGEVLEGEIVFLGLLGDGATTLDVTFNPEPDPGDSETLQPTIAFVDVDIGAGSS